MPIKFRCQHCKQLLGIAHTKAGKLVDCPTCGRTLRVPNLDGTIDPPPVLGMNLADDGLRRALDELGQIGHEHESDITQDSKPLPKAPSLQSPAVKLPSDVLPADGPHTATAAPNPDQARDIQSNPPLVSPIKKSPSWTDGNAQRVIAHSSFSDSENLDPNQAEEQDSLLPPSQAQFPMVKTAAESRPAERAAVIALEPLPSLAAIDPPLAVRNGPQKRGEQAVLAAAVPDVGSQSEEILAGLARSAPAKTGSIRENNAFNSHPAGKVESRVGSRKLVFVMATVGVLCFLAGLGSGIGLERRKSRIAPNSTPQSSSTTPDLIANQAEGSPRFSGQLSYRNSQGRLQPDAGSRILAIPSNTAKETKLPSVGLRPADDQAAREAAAKALAEIGGLEAVADAQGKYVLELPGGGDFQLIALSRFQGRKADTAWPKLADTTLRSLIDRPEQLVGKLAFHVETLQHEGTGAVVWNHVFEME